MSYRLRALLALVILPGLIAGGVVVRLRLRRRPAAEPAAFMRQEPQIMLWAWETPEDLTLLDPKRAGVAFLAREVLLGRDLVVRPRYQPLRIAPGAWLMAVVRIETGPGFLPTPESAQRSADAIADAARLPNVRAVQVDFDATASQRDFYLALLRDLRADLPAGYPLSITALVSWCGPHSWLHGLKIDEAVSMFFRMGGAAATRSTAPRTQSVIEEPLCSGAIGVSTDEAWPVLRPDERVYVFSPAPWTQNELARINRFGYQGLRGLTSP